MRRFRLRLLALVGFVLCHGVLRGADASEATEPDPNVLIATYQELWRDRVRNQLRPIRTEVMVTHYDPTWRIFWKHGERRARIHGEPSGLPDLVRQPGPDRGRGGPWRGLEAEKFMADDPTRTKPEPRAIVQTH